MTPLTANEARSKFTDHVVVGKDILELLSSAMYVDPLSIFREYVQNAADSLDEAKELGLSRNGILPAIAITLDPVARTASVRDTGAGVPRSAFCRILTSIGGSRKRGTAARGFRGVGRLAGLAYCQTLVMRTKSADDPNVSVMQWDCRQLKELLRDPAESTLDEIIQKIVEIERIPAEGFPAHFFEIEMRQVVRHKNDLLLNESALQNYLSQVAPVPFHPDFSFGRDIEAYLQKHNASKAYNVTINGKPVYRPYRDSYEARPKVFGRFKGVAFFEVEGLSSGVDAVGWILHGDYLGAIPDRHGINGLRLRAGNIQIGDHRLLDPAFPEVRFNSWTVGECHVLSPKLVPNARRDNFEQNNHFSNLLTHLAPRTKEIAKACRESSAERTKLRLAAVAERQASGTSLDWEKARLFFTTNADKPLDARHKEKIQKLLQNGSFTYADLIQLALGGSSSVSAPAQHR